MRSFSRAGAAVLASAALLLAVPAYAQTSTAPASAAEAYGLDVDVTLSPLGVPVDVGPLAHATQEYPPQAPEIAEDEVLSTGQIPAGGAVVENIGVLNAAAGANGQPLAAALAQATNVELINQGGTPLITADLIVAASTTDCTNPPSAEGTEFVNLRVAGVEDPIPNPEPNTVLLPEVFTPLGIRVVLNEQHMAADGRGLVVNAIHIYQATGVVPALFTGDVIVSHAMSTVNCPNGAPSTGIGNPIFITKNADKATVKRGETVTYTATVTNTADEACLVNQFIDHLPVAFEYTSTSGSFGTVAEAVDRPGGGQDVVIKPEGMTIPVDGSVTQTFVVKVKDDAAPATYFNNVELLCGNLGNWVKGLDAPVRVVVDTVTPPAPQCSDTKDNDGDGKVDYPNDPGCASPQDNDETDTLPRTGVPGVLAGVAVLAAAGALVLRRALNARP